MKSAAGQSSYFLQTEEHRAKAAEMDEAVCIWVVE